MSFQYFKNSFGKDSAYQRLNWKCLKVVIKSAERETERERRERERREREREREREFLVQIKEFLTNKSVQYMRAENTSKQNRDTSQR